MPVQIVKVDSRKKLRLFIDYPEKLYKDCENWVPSLRGDEFATFNPKKNAAFEYCDAECYLAYRENEIVGRVAAIVNNKANSKWGQKVVRFGWIDFIEDEEVLKSLISAVEKYGVERGCTEIKGPWGFTDMDKEGLLVEGFEHISPFTCIYNYPYYDTMLNAIGFVKDVDWTQRMVSMPDEDPRSFRLAKIIEERYGLHVYQAASMRELADRYGMSIFHMYNESFASLAEFCPLSDRQIKNYIDSYVPIMDKDFVPIVVDSDDNPVGFAFCVPTLSKAVKKARGRLFPFGFIPVLKALKKNDTLEALMIGVLPKYQNAGATVLLLKHVYDNCKKRGVDKMILNPQLEDNVKVQSIFGDFNPVPYIRRRAYRKAI